MDAQALAPDRDDAQHEDHFVILRDVTWADYQRILEIRGDRSAPRITYAEGNLEIRSPSRSHEFLRRLIGSLVEVYCLEAGLEFSTYGSWTLEDKELDRGIEPDECYVFGELPEATRPSLAIEVVWTSGGLRKLDIYRVLGVREVWFWRRGVITVHLLGDGGYAEVSTSEALPGLALDELASFLDRPTTSASMRDYRDALRGRGVRG